MPSWWNQLSPQIRTAPVRLLALLALTGCGSGLEPDQAQNRSRNTADPSIRLSTDRDTYRVGDQVTLTLTNGSGNTILYTFCPETWEHRVGQTWVRSEALMLCIAAFETLAPGKAIRSSVTISDQIQPGEHRLVGYANDSHGSSTLESVITPTFTVQSR